MLNLSTQQFRLSSRLFQRTHLYLDARIGMKRRGRSILTFVVCTVLVAAATGAQVPAPPPAGPVPPAIIAAKKIFVSNAGSDSGLFPHPFSGDPNRAYDQFYGAMKGANQWELVNDPAEANLVLELRLTAPYGPSNADKEKGASDPLPMFRLVVYDARTHYVLWALTEAIDAANLQKTHDHNFDVALGTLVQDFMALSGKAPAPAH